MKRTLLICLLTVPFFTQAQMPDLDLGLKVGANFNQIDGESWESTMKANLLAGAYGSLTAKRLGGQIEILFSQATFSPKDAINGKKGSFKINYLSIPLLLNVKFSKVKLQLGPQYSGVVSVTDKDELVDDAKSLFKSGDFSGVIGLWVDLPLHLNAGARYVIGFTDINNVDGATEAWKQKNIQIHIGYNFF